MKISRYLPAFTILAIVIGFFVLINRPTNQKDVLANPQPQAIVAESAGSTPNIQQEAPVVTQADQVDVIHFHGTTQCWSCVQLGDFALATLEERFGPELASGKIIFKHINAELPENKETVELYQARGSSLFINAIKDGENHIREEVKVWQLITQEDKFKDYLEKEIRQLL